MCIHMLFNREAHRENLEDTENHKKIKCTYSLIPRDLLSLHIKIEICNDI